jgi:cytochrome c oxidase subunit 4
MDTERLRLILWIVCGCLMAAGAFGVGLALFLDRKSARVPTKGAEPARGREARAPALRPRVPVRPISERALAERKATYRLGAYVLIGLAVLTALEVVVASVLEGSVVFLFVIALAKAGVIVQYYMHVNRVWGEEEAH